MSSHHFVKEGQEPALFIIDPISFELVQPLLEWAPLVIVLDSALENVMHWGIKVDIVLTQQNQLEKIKEKVLEQIPVKIISYETGDDPLATGFYFLMSSKQTGVNVIVESNNASIFTLIQNLQSKLTVTLLNKDLKWSFITGGEYKKWFPAHRRIKIQAGMDKQEFSMQGIIPLSSEYNVEKDGQIIIRSESSFWIGEQLK